MNQATGEIFNKELAQDWKDHTKKTELVRDRLQTRLKEAMTEEQTLGETLICLFGKIRLG